MIGFSDCLLNTNKGSGNKPNGRVAKYQECLHFCLPENADSADTCQLEPSSAKLSQLTIAVAGHWFNSSQVQTSHENWVFSCLTHWFQKVCTGGLLCLPEADDFQCQQTKRRQAKPQNKTSTEDNNVRLNGLESEHRTSKQR